MLCKTSWRLWYTQVFKTFSNVMPVSDAKYRVRSLQHFAVDSSTKLLKSGITHETWVLPTDLASLLSRCDTFMTLDQHAHRIFAAAGIPANSFEIVRKTLEKFRESHLLLSSDVLVAREGEPSPIPDARVPLASVSIITADRPSVSQIAIASYLEQVERRGMAAEIRIYDDSRSQSSQDDLGTVIKNLRRRFRTPLRYINSQQKTSIADTLVAHGIDRAVLDYALQISRPTAFTAGANRNLFLLTTAGDLAICNDDDTQCKCVATNVRPHTVTITSLAHPTQTNLFSDSTSCLRHAAFDQDDCVSIHSPVLGRSIPECLHLFRGLDSVNNGRVSDSLASVLEKGSGRVYLTQLGRAGDSGFHSPSFYLFSTAERRQQLFETRDAYNRTSRSRYVIDSVESNTLTDGAHFMACSFGIDNRQPVAPFLPIGRNEDGLFWAVVRKCFPEKLLWLLPLAISHDSGDRGSYPSGAIWRDTIHYRFSSLMECLVENFSGSGLQDGKKLAGLGRYLVNVGNLPENSFKDLVQECLWTVISKKAHLAQVLLDGDGPKPAYWVRDIRQVIALCRTHLMEAAKPRLVDCSLPEAQLNVLQYGRLLECWNDLVRIAENSEVRSIAL